MNIAFELSMLGNYAFKRGYAVGSTNDKNAAPQEYETEQQQRIKIFEAFVDQRQRIRDLEEAIEQVARWIEDGDYEYAQKLCAEMLEADRGTLP